MLRRFSVNFAIFSIVLDGILVVTGLALATFLRPLFNEFSFVQPLPEVKTPLALYFIAGMIWVLVLLLFSVYDGRRNIRIVDEFASLTVGAALAAVASAGALYLSFRDVSRLLFLVFVVLSYLFLLVWRMAARLIFRWRGFPVSRRRVLIIGGGKVGDDMRQQIAKFSDMGLDFAGFLDDERSGEEIIGYLAEAREVVVREAVDEIVIALPGWAHERTNHLVAELHDLPVKVWVIPDYFSITLYRARVEEFAGIPLLDLRAPALNDYQRMLKRAFDLAVTLLLMPPALVLMGMAAIAVRLDSPGPALFRQKRAGENGRLFEMLKFRSMVFNAEKLRNEVEAVNAEGEVVHKSTHDPRTTRVGRFLRRTSLDELPQLFNVLRGDMSLVGPRPELPYLVDEYELWQRIRFAIPPGMTGWWQITGRSDKPMHLNTEDDLYYVQNYSIGLDIFILLKTIWVVLRGQGAY